jgi:peptidoglycan/xylan/chitin deacetylase (PgdA/CDA1 family)
MRRIIQTYLVALLSISLLAGAEPSSTTAVDPYGIIKKPIPDKTVVLTFDDACRSHATFVAPLLKEYGFGGSFYITTAFGFKTRKDWYMTWEQIKAINFMS